MCLAKVLRCVTQECVIITSKNYTRKDIKSRLISGNCFQLLLRNVLSCSFPISNLTSKIILSVVLYCCETWSVTVTVERQLITFEFVSASNVWY